MTAFLLLINIYNSVVNETPNSDEMTALEVWSLGCISVVFGTILTYAIILSRDQMIIQGVLNSEGELLEESSAHQQKLAWSAQEDKTRLSLKVRDDQRGHQTETWPSFHSQEKTKKNVTLEFSLFLVVFLSFAIFNVIYWTRSRPGFP